MKYILFIFISLSAHASYNNVSYKADFGNCPKKTTGEFVLSMIEEFEGHSSLAKLKKNILKQELDKKHFLSNYKITFSPLENRLEFKFECPNILAKVQVYKSDGSELYNALLVDTGKIIDPNYEVYLRSENIKLPRFPFLSLTYKEIDEKFIQKVTNYLISLDKDFFEKISEVIFDKSDSLTLILRGKKKAVSALLGKSEWKEKTKKLSETIKYFASKNQLPSLIKFSGSKKVIVKFSKTL